MRRTMKWKGFAWLLLAACLVTLLLPWMKLNENGVTAGDMLEMIIRPMSREELEQELRESLEDFAEDAALEGYQIDAGDLSYAFRRILDGDLRLWQIPRVAAAMGDFMGGLSRLMRSALDMAESESELEEEFEEFYGMFSVTEMVQMARGMTELMEDEAAHYRTDALLYRIFAGLTLAGLILAAVCVARGKCWGSFVFSLAALALFVLNALVVHRDNGLSERFMNLMPAYLQYAAPMMRSQPDFFHIGAAPVCLLIFAILLVLHVRFDLIGLAGRLTLRPKESAEETPEAQPEIPETTAVPAEQPEIPEAPETPAEPSEPAPEAPAPDEETREEERPETAAPGQELP